MSDETTAWLDRVQTLAEKAHDHIGKLCTQEHQWTMTVPPRDDDSDVLLTEAVAVGEKAATALRAVSDLHQPDDGGHCTECIIGHDGDSLTAGAPVHDAWPCPTVQAIANAIGVQVWSQRTG